jgi:hypothetical protein
MRFIIMHKTDERFENGARPDAETIARVGRMIGALSRAGALEAGEGLGPSSKGVRLRFRGGASQVMPGPFVGEHELPAAFSIIRTRTLDEAIEWATAEAAALGDTELDIRPVNEPWDIGIGQKPADLDTSRYMVLRKATASTEAGVALSPAKSTSLTRLIEETTRAGVHVTTETMRPSARGRRYLNTSNGISVFDGPFVESKELLGGYVIISAASLDEVDRWAREYIAAVGPREVDVLELE